MPTPVFAIILGLCFFQFLYGTSLLLRQKLIPACLCIGFCGLTLAILFSG